MKTPQCSSTSEWISKWWYSHTLELSNKKEQNYWCTHDIRCIMVSERSQTQKATYWMIPCIWHFCKGKTIGTANTSAVGGGGEKGGAVWGLCNCSVSWLLWWVQDYTFVKTQNCILRRMRFYCTWIIHQWIWLKRKKNTDIQQARLVLHWFWFIRKLSMFLCQCMVTNYYMKTYKS